jgi:hypothetical protein
MTNYAGRGGPFVLSTFFARMSYRALLLSDNRSQYAGLRFVRRLE